MSGNNSSQSNLSSRNNHNSGVDDLLMNNLNIGIQRPVSNMTSSSAVSINNQPPKQTPPTVPPQSSSTSSHPQLKSDIQARLMAFQQRRAKLGNSDSNNSQLSSSMSPPPLVNDGENNTSTNTSRNHLQTSISEKQLPPLPGSESIRSAMFNNDKRTLLHESITSSSTPGSPVSAPPDSTQQFTYPMPTRGHTISGRIPSSNLTQTIDLKKKPSLSQRRGMKLNVSDLAIGNSTPNTPSPRMLSPVAYPDNNQGDISSAGSSSSVNNNNRPTSEIIMSQTPIANQLSVTPHELSRRLSERKNKPNFKLNLDGMTSNDLPNSMPSLSRSASLTRSSNPTSNSSEGCTPEEKQQQQQQQQQQEQSNSQMQSPQQTPNNNNLHGLFANYSKYVDIKSGQLKFAGKASLHSEGVDFLSGSSFRISLDELEYIEELGHGNYGSVLKVLHKPTGVLMAMKEVRLELDETKFTQILMELDVLHKCNSPFIVDFYGAFFVEGAVYMCIEYMDGGSLDKIFGSNIGCKDEAALAYVTESVIRGLKELKDKHNIIHRDVKPTNILVNTLGEVKLCDFGVSGNLVASLAKTNIGCQSYMAPERIRSITPNDATYSVHSDIWSLGLTILEIAVGHYPYPPETYDNIFSQLSAIVDGEPPKLDQSIFSKEAQMFVKSCLNKNPDLRPSYAALLHHPWLVKYRGQGCELIREAVTKRLDDLEEIKKQRKAGGVSRTNSRTAAIPPPTRENVQSLLRSKVKAPALHRGGLTNMNSSFLNRSK